MVASFPQSVRSCLKVERRSIIGDDGQFDREELTATCSYHFADLDRNAIAEAEAILASHTRPASQTDIFKWLAKLKVKTSGRGQAADEIQFQLGVYAEELAAWPSDVVGEVLGEYRSKWWPSWSELVGLLEIKAGYRSSVGFVLRSRRARKHIAPGVWRD